MAKSNCSLNGTAFVITPFPGGIGELTACNLSTGFTPLFSFNMSRVNDDPQACQSVSPSLVTSPIYGCSPPPTQFGICTNLTISASFEFNEVMIEPVLFGAGSPDGLSKAGIVDGLVIATGDTDEIVWAFAVSNDIPEISSERCPCDRMFFLEPNQTRKEALIQSGRFWCDQVLRGGMSQVNQAFQANSSNLCAFVMLGTQNRPENKAVKVVLAKPSTSLVVMLCRDQPSSNEEVFLHTLQLSVRETPGFVRPCFTTPTPQTFSLRSATESTTTIDDRLTLPSQTTDSSSTTSNGTTTADGSSTLSSSSARFESTASSESSLPIAAIVGGSVGGFVVVLLMGVLIGWCFARRRTRGDSSTPEAPTPSSSPTGTLTSTGTGTEMSSTRTSEYSRVDIGQSNDYEVGNFDQR